MEKETMNATPPLSEEFASTPSSMCTFDLPTLIEKMKHSHSWTHGEFNAVILLKSPEKQIVLTALHEGTEIKSRQSNDSITFQIIEGKVKFHTQKGSVILDKGQLLTLHDNINYSLTTREESVLLLTIANSILEPAEN